MKDIIIIGGGPGGYESAIRGAQLGASVCLIENDEIGGTCLNRGCIPTKALCRNAEIVEILKQADAFGIELETFSLNVAKIQSRKQGIVKSLVEGIYQLLEANKIEIIKGFGTLKDANTVLVKTIDGVMEVKGKNIILATGSVPSSISVPGADLPGIVTSNELLEFDHIPKSMIVIGGGVVAIEFAGIFSSFGTAVTLLVRSEIIKFVDSDITKRLVTTLKRKGMDIQTKLSFKKIEKTESGQFRVTVDSKKGEAVYEADMLLMASGRESYTQGLGLENLGIVKGKKGIDVNENYQTNVPNIYAIGDVNGLWMLAHVASHHGIHAVEHIMGHKAHINHVVVPSCVFVMPEVATVGLTEEQVLASGKPYETNKFMFAANGKALALGEGEGLVKVIACEDKIVGVHIMGPHASDLIHEAALAINKGMGVADIANAIHAHPTLSEAFVEAVLGLRNEAIHQMPKKKR